VRVADVVPDIPVSGIAESYTYLAPDDIQRGDGVLVPFGGRTIVGYVVRVREADAAEFRFKLKPISAVIAGLSLPEGLMRTLTFLSEEFLAPPGAAIAVAMPPGVRSRLSTAYISVEETVRPLPSTPQPPPPPGREEGETGEEGLSAAEDEALRLIREKGGRLSERALWGSNRLARSVVASLVKKGLLRKAVELPPEKRRGPKVIKLGEATAVHGFLEKESKRKPAQAALLLALKDAPGAQFTPGEAVALAGVTESVVGKLLEAGLLVEAQTEPVRSHEPKPPTPDQAVAIKAIGQSVRSGAGERFLLHGVTGSGKTEVYLHAVAETLNAGRQALYLVPEIALTAQVVGQLRERFGSSVAVMHSGLAEGERLRHWRRARIGDAPVVIGARSAVFAPLENIGLIVVDEEHEGSYKQENMPRYDMRALAEFRAKDSGATLVLGSATPSVESYYRADPAVAASPSGTSLTLLTLTRRATEMNLPEVVITDLREVYKSGHPAIIGPELKVELERVLAAGEQAMLFINRRAYAHALLCRDCGHQPRCPNCSVALTFHRTGARLKCHHCGLNRPAPDTCPSCSSLRLRPLGLGTEKVEETAKAEFPGARVARLDRDIARRKGAVEQLFSNLRDGELDILVGTQMIAKGLDFPNVTLVGVIAADTGLSVPDYRSTERTFQLITQVSGRAGRRKPGRVVIQSFQPEHPAIRFAAAKDYLDFYRAEIEERRDAGYPPFTRLVNVVASSRDQADCQEAIQKVASHLGGIDGATVVGPADCAFSKLHGLYRKHVLVKTMRPSSVSIPEELNLDRSVQISVDVDPGSLL
jgi:primosomal protein N' (replication factor Y)